MAAPSTGGGNPRQTAASTRPISMKFLHTVGCDPCDRGQPAEPASPFELDHDVDSRPELSTHSDFPHPLLPGQGQRLQPPEGLIGTVA